MRQVAGIVLYGIGFIAVVAAMLGIFVAAADPYGLDTYGIAVLGKETPRAGRAERDRIFRPLDIAAQQPRTIFIGTSRTKQALNPALLDRTALAAAYNAGVDRAQLGEMRALLQDAIREDHNLRYVFIELYPSQFFIGRDIHAGLKTLMSTRPWILTADAIATARDTVAAAIKGQAIKYAVGQNGMQIGPPVRADTATWAPPLFRAWKARDPALIDEINNGSFGQIDEMRATCETAAIRCIFYVPPMSPPSMAVFRLENTLDVFLDWKRRLAAFGGVIDFSRPGTPFWEVANAQSLYWADTGHFSAEGGALILAGLRRAINGQSIEPAAYLTDAEVDRQAVEWPPIIAAYLDADPTLAASYAAQ